MGMEHFKQLLWIKMCCKWKIHSEFQRQYLRKESPSMFYINCCCLVTKSCPTVCNPMDCTLPGSSMGFSRKNAAVGCHFPLQGIFPGQGSNPCLLHWQTDSLPLNHWGSPIMLLPFFIFIKGWYDSPWISLIFALCIFKALLLGTIYLWLRCLSDELTLLTLQMVPFKTSLVTSGENLK